jgi:hypothetical protein
MPRGLTWLAALDLIGHDQEKALWRKLRAGHVEAWYFDADGEAQPLRASDWDPKAELDRAGARLAIVRFQAMSFPGPLRATPPDFVSFEIDEATLLENFPQASRSPQLQPQTRGRKRIHAWEQAVLAVASQIYHGEVLEPEQQADVEGLVAGWFATNAAEEPSESQVRNYARLIWKIFLRR